MPKHKSNPRSSIPFSYSTGRAPGAKSGTLLVEQARHILNWSKRGQLFTYAGPGPFDRALVQSDSEYIHLNPDYDYQGTPYFSVITKSESFSAGSSQLGGFVIPWRYQKGAELSWTPSGQAEFTFFTAAADSHDDIDLVRFSNSPAEKIKMYNGIIDPGVSGGGFSSHKLAYSGIMIAGVGIWEMPDRSLDVERRIFDLEQFLISRQVRGWTTGARRGLGKMIGELSDIIYRNGRCLLQSGHPTGVCTYSTTYVNLRHDAGSAFLVEPVGLYRGDDIPCTPCIVAGAVGASVGNPAYVKFESVASADSYEFEITSDTEALYTAAAELDCYRFSEQVSIGVKAPTDGVVYVRSFSLWED